MKPTTALLVALVTLLGMLVSGQAATRSPSGRELQRAAGVEHVKVYFEAGSPYAGPQPRWRLHLVD
jgi:hypothetical protein